jgi:hypothetical protein
MPTAEKRITIQDSFYDAEIAVDEGFGSDVLASTVDVRERISARWSAIVDHSLIEWGQGRSSLELEGMTGPSSEAVAKAGKLVVYMRDHDWTLPTGVIADGEGGIVFENKQDPNYQRIEIDAHGTLNLVTFRDCRLVRQEQLNIE